MKKEIIPQPYIASMTYDEDCWLVVDCRSSDSAYVTFYNPKQDPDKEYETLREYAESYIDNEFCSFEDKNVEYKDNTASASGCNVTEDDDYDEESGRSWKVMVADGQVIEVMTGIKLENIKEIVKKVESSLDDMESDAKYNAADAAEERRDPYAYRGLSRRDFI